MGNKEIGRAYASLPFDEYVEAMGGEAFARHQINPDKTGINYANPHIWMYFDLLMELAVNRVEWYSKQIPKRELKLIEYNIFMHKYCAMVKPRILMQNKTYYQSPHPRIFQCNFTKENFRTGRPERISLVNTFSEYYTLDVNYNADEFVIFTDKLAFPQYGVPFCRIAWEYACKFYEHDLTFNSNSQKMRLPVLYNDRGVKPDSKNLYGIKAVTQSIAEIVRSALGRNEMHVSIPEDNVSENGVLHETQYVQNELPTLIESQTNLWDKYFELLGIYTNKEKRGSYTVKDLQERGDGSENYRTHILTRTRVNCMEEAAELFKIDLGLEVRDWA